MKRRSAKPPPPGYWDVEGYGRIPIDLIQRCLTMKRGPLAPEDRAVLAALLARIGAASARTQKELGIKARRTRTDARNEAAAEKFVRLCDSGKGYEAAHDEVLSEFGKGVRDTIESADEVARARGRLLLDASNKK